MLFFQKREKIWFFSIFIQRGDPLMLKLPNHFFLFFKTWFSFFKKWPLWDLANVKETKSWSLATPTIKMWKYQTGFGHPGQIWPLSVGIGLMHVRTEKWLFRRYKNGKVMQVLLKYATNNHGNYRLRDTRHSSHMGSEARCREK